MLYQQKHLMLIHAAKNDFFVFVPTSYILMSPMSLTQPSSHFQSHKTVNISCIQWGKLKINICAAICSLIIPFSNILSILLPPHIPHFSFIYFFPTRHFHLIQAKFLYKHTSLCAMLSLMSLACVKVINLNLHFLEAPYVVCLTSFLFFYI